MRAIPLTFSVSAAACDAPDRVFANGFDDDADGACGQSIRTFDERDAFIAAVAPGYEQNAFTRVAHGLRAWPASVRQSLLVYRDRSARERHRRLLSVRRRGRAIDGFGERRVDAHDHVHGAHQSTAFGANFWGQLFQTLTSVEMNLQPATTIRIELDDGTVRIVHGDESAGFSRLRRDEADPHADAQRAASRCGWRFRLGRVRQSRRRQQALRYRCP